MFQPEKGFSNNYAENVHQSEVMCRPCRHKVKIMSLHCLLQSLILCTIYGGGGGIKNMLVHQKQPSSFCLCVKYSKCGECY